MSKSTPDPLEPLDADTARRLAGSLIALLDEARDRVRTDDESELVAMVTGHIGCPIADMPNVSTKFQRWEHINLHLGVTAYLARHSPDAHWFGVTGVQHGFQDLLDMLTMAEQRGSYQVGPVDYVTAATGPDTAMDIVHFGVVRTRSASGHPVVLGLRGPALERGPEPLCVLRVLAADRDVATEVRAEIETLARQHDVHRGQLLSFDVSEHRGNELVSFLPRPTLAAHDVVLPAGVLDTIQWHVVRTARLRDRLRDHGQHLKRGILLYGPPGTGKTHTVRYLMGQLTEATVLVMTGRALTMLLPTAVSIARRLQPAVVVLEDIDLIAEDRRYGNETPVLFDLLNRIDGMDADADVTFVLTTNRVDVVERALTERPGRVDLAVEIPKPDAAGRERLLRLYAEGTELDLPDPAALIAATDGVTASFIREWVRRAVADRLAELPDGQRVRLTAPVLATTLDELLDQRNRLTSTIIGGARPAD